MTNLEKIDLLNIKIANAQFHIDILAADIEANPYDDVEEKADRRSVLQDFELKRNALLLEKEALTNQG